MHPFCYCMHTWYLLVLVLMLMLVPALALALALAWVLVLVFQQSVYVLAASIPLQTMKGVTLITLRESE